MRNKYLSLIFIGLALFAEAGYADATLKSALGLSVDQARLVHQIQQQSQPKFAAKRTEQNNERRRLTRAKLANDSKLIAEQEKVVTRLHNELLQIKAGEDEAVRRLLTPEQSKKFDDYLKLRREMKGSSRDDKESITR